jgi:hypothetical protein
MLEDIAKTSDNLLRKELIVPESNRGELSQPIVPERFSSTTSPVHGGILPPEYTSVTTIEHLENYQ